MEKNPSKFSDIYDRLNKQPHLQEIIKQSYYDCVLADEATISRKEIISEFQSHITRIDLIYVNGWVNSGNFAPYLLWEKRQGVWEYL